MLAYAAHRRTIAGRRSAPHAFLVIIVAHIALIAAVMSAKMEMSGDKARPTDVTLIPLPAPPPPEVEPREVPKSAPSSVDRAPVIVPVRQPMTDQLDPTIIPSFPNTTVVQPRPGPLPTVAIAAKAPVRIAARFATPDWAVRPPYPASKLDSGEEAMLKLRLSIDERGRVTAVEPIGAADPAFLAAARRHLLARWRYQPATEDGQPVASATRITLRFELDD